MASRKISGTLTALRISLALALAMLLAGCNWFGSGSGSPTPTPHPPPATVSRSIVGHSEVKGADGKYYPSTDDGYQCFKRDDTRNVVLKAVAPEIRTGKISVTLIDIKKGFVNDPPKVDVADDTATITFSDHRQHLGPGPYVATTSIDPTTASKSGRDGKEYQPVVLAYSYVTYPNDNGECPVWGAQVAAHP